MIVERINPLFKGLSDYKTSYDIPIEKLLDAIIIDDTGEFEWGDGNENTKVLVLIIGKHYGVTKQILNLLAKCGIKFLTEKQADLRPYEDCLDTNDIKVVWSRIDPVAIHLNSCSKKQIERFVEIYKSVSDWKRLHMI